MKIILISLLALSLSVSEANNSDTVIDLELPSKEVAKEADSLFKKAEYEAAIPLYFSLAEIGDKYSQYKLAIIYQNGLGVSEDIRKAYGWAYLARENKNPELMEYYQSVAAQIIEADLEKAEFVKEELYGRYSNLRLARKFRNMVKKSIPKCSGSRIRGNCTTVKVYCVSESSESTKEKCRKQALLRKPYALRELKQKLLLVNQYLEDELQRKTKITVDRVEDETN